MEHKVAENGNITVLELFRYIPPQTFRFWWLDFANKIYELSMRLNILYDKMYINNITK